jgi:hypothetical protein
MMTEPSNSIARVSVVAKPALHREVVFVGHYETADLFDSAI